MVNGSSATAVISIGGIYDHHYLFSQAAGVGKDNPGEIAHAMVEKNLSEEVERVNLDSAAINGRKKAAGKEQQP